MEATHAHMTKKTPGKVGAAVLRGALCCALVAGALALGGCDDGSGDQASEPQDQVSQVSATQVPPAASQAEGGTDGSTAASSVPAIPGGIDWIEAGSEESDGACAPEFRGVDELIVQADDSYSCLVSATEDTRTLELPRTFFDSMDTLEVDYIITSLETQGCTDVSYSADSDAFTFTMDVGTWEGMVTSIWASAIQTLGAVTSSDGGQGNVELVRYDRDLAHVELRMRTDEPQALEYFWPYLLGSAACMYQQVAGAPIDCTIWITGPDGEPMTCVSMPDALASIEASQLADDGTSDATDAATDGDGGTSAATAGSAGTTTP